MDADTPTLNDDSELAGALDSLLDAMPEHNRIDEHDYLKNQIMQLIHQRDEARDKQTRLHERKELRSLFDALGMQFGASAGSATGVIVRNDFGEEFIFQLDRDALGALLSRFNSKLTNPEKGNSNG